MKRTVKVWLAAVMSGVILAGGAGTTGQAPWGMESQAHSGRTDANGGHRDNKNASGLGSYHYHCGGHPAHLHPNGVCPYAGGAQTKAQTQTQAQIPTKAANMVQETQAGDLDIPAVRAVSRERAADTTGWNQNGTQWNYICEDGTQLIGCWKQIDGVWYCFDSDGNMRTGWYRENGCLYYLGTDGKMVTGTCMVDGTEYQFDQDGKMITEKQTGLH
ncbi:MULTISPECIES: YHYH domain-containing protein [unclassified Clostridium]|uniref:YHYH domain-containing protein n=1 Tax=unclassified Clostridium TaxID=2614128 RepID=UPI0011072AE4|nr:MULTISPECIES: YHYH domain-containing protein [unclassified Clostridium]